VDFRERIVVDGVPISSEAVVDFIARWTPLVESLGATFFEATTVLAFAHCAAERVDVALIETGLGGRLDTTNVVDPVSAGVTSIGFDHMEYLGNTLEAIAGEKAGIFKPGRPAVIGEPDPHIREFLAARARAAGASEVRVVSERCVIEDVVVDGDGTALTLTVDGVTRRIRTPLAGRHQAQNLAFTLEWLNAAGTRYAVTLDEAAQHLGGVSIPGRFQRVGKYLFDVAHNEDGARVLARTMASVAPAQPVVAVLCALRDKDWRGMLGALREVVTEFVLTDAPTAPASRTWDLAEAAEFAAAQGMTATACHDFGEALSLAEERGATVLVTGSFHTVGDAMARLHVSPLAR
ncbi:MAG TPA: Mur ligase family protein, partial [Gemmatimonadaceae bacterium]|nr:Mur ligase family protein [Gemmatimonadaceae bacterium]